MKWGDETWILMGGVTQGSRRGRGGDLVMVQNKDFTKFGSVNNTIHSGNSSSPQYIQTKPDSFNVSNYFYDSIYLLTVQTHPILDHLYLFAHSYK